MSFRPSRALPAVVATASLVALGVLPAAAQDAEPTVTTQVVTSFDDTEIYTTLFVPPGATESSPVPLVLRTHGWGGSGQTDVSGTLERLLDEGYAVLTWDQRGFGQSGGEVMVDKPEFEGKDASALIDWAVANVPSLAYESPGDPIVGFTGGSYAGGIQTATSSIDPRVDAIAPEISWEDLRYSLFENGVVNFGWSQLLFGAGLATAVTGGLDPSGETGIETGAYTQELYTSEAEGLVFGENANEDSLAFFAASSIAGYGDSTPVTVPALVMNGSVDTLFDLSDGVRIFDHVRAQGVDAKYIAFCGGHVACPGSYAEVDDRAHLDDAIVTWFAKHLKGEDVDTGALVEYRTNEGEWRTTDVFPTAGQGDVTADFEASLLQLGVPDPFAAENGLPVIAVPSQSGDPQATTVEVLAAEDGPVDLLGLPFLRIAVGGTGDTAHVFAKLVHREAGEVVNLQETPLRVEGLGDPQEFELEMSGVAYTIPEGDHLDLQLTTSSLMHLNARGPAQVTVSGAVFVPTRSTAAPTPTSTSAPDPAPSVSDTPAPAPAATPSTAPAPATPMPSTGGGAVLLGVLALAGAAATRRRARD